MGIKAEPTAEILHLMLQISSSGLCGFKIHTFRPSKFFHFFPPPYPCPHYFSLAQQSAQ